MVQYQQIQIRLRFLTSSLPQPSQVKSQVPVSGDRAQGAEEPGLSHRSVTTNTHPNPEKYLKADRMCSRMLKEQADVLARLFSTVFESFQRSRYASHDWRKANISYAFKQGKGQSLGQLHFGTCKKIMNSQNHDVWKQPLTSIQSRFFTHAGSAVTGCKGL